jgi:hypothetical protein
MQLINIPTLTDSDSDCEILFGIARRVRSLKGKDVVFDFSNCMSIMQNTVAVLGGLTKLAQHFGNDVEFAWATLVPKVREALEISGLMTFLGQETTTMSRTAVPFRHNESLVEDDLVHYLYNSWIGAGRVLLSDPLKDAIIGKVLEIYVNAFDHSHSPVGVFTAGQYYRPKKVLKLSTVDFGVGIPDNVRALGFKDWKKSGAETMRWAFTRGNSTRPERKNLARGLGLDLLREFVKINKGELKIFSHDGQAVIDQLENFRSRDPKQVFPGTLVNITFSCDKIFYRLASEKPDRPLF